MTLKETFRGSAGISDALVRPLVFQSIRLATHWREGINRTLSGRGRVPLHCIPKQLVWAKKSLTIKMD